MFAKKRFRGVAAFTLFFFACFALTSDYSFSQDENPLLTAQGLYKQGNFVEAVKVLEAFIGKIKDDPGEKKRLAEAYYLLARIYYEAGEDDRVTGYMERAVAADVDIGREEGNLDFKSRLERVREQWLKANAEEKKAAPAGAEKAAATQPLVREREKPAAQLKKKKKFPWLLVLAGIGLAVILVVVLTKKKKQTLTVTVGEGVAGNPAAGTYSYKKGERVSYSYSLSSEEYRDLSVLLDGSMVPASGSLVMDGNHALSASASKREATFTDGVLTVKGVRYELAPIPAGTFKMGSNSPEAYDDEQPVHTVRITRPLWLGRTEVTQGLWRAVMNGNPSFFNQGDSYPVEQVTWNDCRNFITTLNQMLGRSAFRLPTEAEWEYSCRAGTTGDRYGDLDAIAWYSANSGDSTRPVGQKTPNSWGLYDMLGNVWEWCQDWYKGSYYNISPFDDPQGPSTGSMRVKRGGGWDYDAVDVRSAVRSQYLPGDKYNVLGFRLAADR